MRLFTALEIPESWRIAVRRASVDLEKRSSLPLRLSPASNSHLTVRFLGEVDDDRVPALTSAIEGLRAEPCELRLAAAGTFGGASRTRVVWLGVEGDLDCLASLVGALDRALTDAGLTVAGADWRPHLTLARVRDGATAGQRRTLAELVQTLEPPDPAPFTANTLELVRSHIGSGPARYEVLTRVRFG